MLFAMLLPFAVSVKAGSMVELEAASAEIGVNSGDVAIPKVPAPAEVKTEKGFLQDVIDYIPFLRTYRLDAVPEGVDYDEAGNFILAGEIARGESFPIFIRAYAGREALFYWLAGASMRLLGETRVAGPCDEQQYVGQPGCLPQCAGVEEDGL